MRKGTVSCVREKEKERLEVKLIKRGKREVYDMLSFSRQWPLFSSEGNQLSVNTSCVFVGLGMKVMLKATF